MQQHALADHRLIDMEHADSSVKSILTKTMVERRIIELTLESGWHGLMKTNSLCSRYLVMYCWKANLLHLSKRGEEPTSIRFITLRLVANRGE
jgi:hypothetical protein